MLLGKLCWGNPSQTAVEADLIEVASPVSDHASGMMQRLEPLLVQALVAELAVEALDVAVLHGLARSDQDVPDAMAGGPGHEGSTGELRAVIGPHRRGVAAEDRCLVEHACHVRARDAEIHGDVDALVAEVIGHQWSLAAGRVPVATTHST